MFGAGTQAAVKELQTQYQVPATGVLDDTTQAILARAAGAVATNQSQVSGRLFLDYGLPAKGLAVRLYARGFAGADTKVAESRTDDNGLYISSYRGQRGSAGGGRPGKETPISVTKFRAAQLEVMSLVVPASLQPLALEFQRASDMDKYIGGLIRAPGGQHECFARHPNCSSVA